MSCWFASHLIVKNCFYACDMHAYMHTYVYAHFEHVRKSMIFPHTWLTCIHPHVGLLWNGFMNAESSRSSEHVHWASVGARMYMCVWTIHTYAHACWVTKNLRNSWFWWDWHVELLVHWCIMTFTYDLIKAHYLCVSPEMYSKRAIMHTCTTCTNLSAKKITSDNISVGLADMP